MGYDSAPMRAIDTRHLGNEKVICCWEVDGVLVDPGPESTLATVLDALGDTEPRAILLTHIHFDHAGATGALLRRWPDLPVYVHERGARHIIAPERLVASAARLYGGEEGLARLWGDDELERRGVSVLRLVRAGLPRSPTSFGWMLVALDQHLAPHRELAIVGDPRADVADERGPRRRVQIADVV